MADVKPFVAVIPKKGLEDKIAALPYDVYNREEAKKVVESNPLSFLRIDRAETNFNDEVSTYEPCVYQKADELLKEMIASGKYVEEEKERYYLYQLTMNSRSQTGIVACASIDDYVSGVIKKHENTREEKEIDRINHIRNCNAQTGPIFLAFRQTKELEEVMKRIETQTPLFDFTSEDGIRHTVFSVDEEDDNQTIKENFQNMKQIYIADGHHRCASAVKVGLERRIEGKTQESDYFLSVLFPENQLKILDYNRVIKDTNGKTTADIIEELEKKFDMKKESSQVHPSTKGEFGMYMDGQWYRLKIKDKFCNGDPVEGLDVSILQKQVLEPIFDIQNPKTDKRIDFVGGIRGLDELEKRVHTDCKVAFSMFPTSIEELFEVADAGRLMPPKSTWFEPKLRSGLFIHKI